MTRELQPFLIQQIVASAKHKLKNQSACFDFNLAFPD